MPKGIYEPIGVGSGSGSSGGGSSLTLTDGTNTVADVGQITVTGGTVGGTTPDATLTITGGGGRTLLAANATYYVNSSTGSNGNPGTALLPFATAQYAWDHLASTLDPGSFDVTINLIGAGPYTCIPNAPWISGHIISWVGDSGTPTVFNDLTYQNQSFGPAQINHDTLTFAAVSQSYAVSCFATDGAYSFGYSSGTTNNFGTGIAAAIGAIGQSVVLIGGTINCTPSGTAIGFLQAEKSEVRNIGTVNMLGSPGSGIVNYILNGAFYYDNATWSGSITGIPFVVNGARVELNTSSNLGTFASGNPVAYNGGTIGPYQPPSSIFTPTTGATITLTSDNLKQIVNPAGTLATLTINLPPIASVVTFFGLTGVFDVDVSTTHTLTALTVATTDGSSVVGAPSTLAANSGFGMEYDSASDTWYPTLGQSSGGGGGAVSSVSGTSGLIDVSPTTGATVVTLDPAVYFTHGANYFFSGGGNTSVSGSNNFGIGSLALASVSSGSDNTTLGASAAQSLQSGANNVAIGPSALSVLTSGSDNIAIGNGTLQSLATDGSGNVAIGYQALQNGNTDFSANVGIGSFALQSVTGNQNVAIGYFAGGDVTSGGDNTFIGRQSGLNVVGGSNNTWVGANVSPASNVSTTIGIGTGDGTLQLDYNYTQSSVWTIASGVGLRLGNAYVGTPIVPTGYVELYDSTGTLYKIPALAA